MWVTSTHHQLLTGSAADRLMPPHPYVLTQCSTSFVMSWGTLLHRNTLGERGFSSKYIVTWQETLKQAWGCFNHQCLYKLYKTVTVMRKYSWLRSLWLWATSWLDLESVLLCHCLQWYVVTLHNQSSEKLGHVLSTKVYKLYPIVMCSWFNLSCTALHLL